MKILYIGEKSTYEQYVKGKVPSHWLYGAVEMEQEGHTVLWKQEKSGCLNDFKYLLSEKTDAIFIPNLNLHNHFLLLLFASVGLVSTPLYAYLHHEPVSNRGIKGIIYRLLFKGLKHVFFLSGLSMKRTVDSGLLEAEKCSVPGWGPDLRFYENISVADNGWYVSTGKENRDFDIIIAAFRSNGLPLHIMTSTSHNGEDYTDLTEKCHGLPNIKVTLLKSSPENYATMVREMAAARALVCPLRRDKLNYCVGLSTIVDAEGLNKPLIITENPYHAGREDGLVQATSLVEWMDAVKIIERGVERPQSTFSMSTAYQHMKRHMNL